MEESGQEYQGFTTLKHPVLCYDLMWHLLQTWGKKIRVSATGKLVVVWGNIFWERKGMAPFRYVGIPTLALSSSFMVLSLWPSWWLTHRGAPAYQCLSWTRELKALHGTPEGVSRAKGKHLPNLASHTLARAAQGCHRLPLPQAHSWFMLKVLSTRNPKPFSIVAGLSPAHTGSWAFCFPSSGHWSPIQPVEVCLNSTSVLQPTHHSPQFELPECAPLPHCSGC